MFPGVIVQPLEKDNELIIENYWNSFHKLFPNITLNQFTNWISEDTYGGWEDVKHRHAGGRRELKMLYASIRATKPKNLLEIGTYDGCSTNHILLAAEKNSSDGYPCNITTVDINDYVGNKQLHDFPLTRFIEPCLTHLRKHTHYDFIMQDGDHSPSAVNTELQIFKTLPNLKTVWSHDYYLRGTLEPTFTQNQDMWSKNSPFKEESYNAGFHIGII